MTMKLVYWFKCFIISLGIVKSLVILFISVYLEWLLRFIPTLLYRKWQELFYINYFTFNSLLNIIHYEDPVYLILQKYFCLKKSLGLN